MNEIRDGAAGSRSVRKTVLAGMCLAIALLLPFVTGQIPEIGKALCPMHIPVLLCGFLCGWPWGLAVGFVAPLLRFALFGMPALFPTGVAMAFELATYGAVSGLLYRALPRKPLSVYAALIAAMLAGRVMWGGVRFLLAGLDKTPFPFAAFWAGAVVNALPGILCHILLIPLIVFALERAGFTSRT